MKRAPGNVSQLSGVARQAAQAGDWRTVSTCSRKILKQKADEPEGHFLAGLAESGSGNATAAIRAFERVLKLDARRYDAAIELARQYIHIGRHGEALRLLDNYESHLGNSPLYLDIAGTLYTWLDLHERALPVYQQANQLQPGIDLFQANLAACCVYLGRIDEARDIYLQLLERFPNHQRNHYELSRLQRAVDTQHIEQMRGVLRSTNLPPEQNIFLYYAIGKELEDLEQWDEAFNYYRMAGDAATSVANYDVAADLKIIDSIIKINTKDWLAAGQGKVADGVAAGIPIFIVGLPRTGTTLTDRIISSHSCVESAGESYFMQMTLQQLSGVDPRQAMTAAVINTAAKKNSDKIAHGYLQAIGYRLTGKPMFIDKFPENFLYLGFIARAFPQARIVHLRRNPMDTCFAMYKQSFFRYAYNLEDLGQYYVAHNRLLRHWRAVLGEKLIEVQYEQLVADQEGQTRILLDRLGLEFEPGCLDFVSNTAAAATASAVQVREKIHNRSVGRWQRFERQLQPLREHLDAAGINVEY